VAVVAPGLDIGQVAEFTMDLKIKSLSGAVFKKTFYNYLMIIINIIKQILKTGDHIHNNSIFFVTFEWANMLESYNTLGWNGLLGTI
jgi:hypothetical protein